MRRFGTAVPLDWKTVFTMRWSWTWPIAAILGLTCLIALREPSKLLLRHPLKLIVFFWGIALFGGFLLTAWVGDGFPRYFCPSALVLLCFLTDAFRHSRVPRLLEITLAALLLIGTVLHVETLQDS